MQEPPAVLRDVLAPSLRPDHVEEARVAAQLLPEHRPERGLGAQDLQPPNARVNAALQCTEARFHRLHTLRMGWSAGPRTANHRAQSVGPTPPHPVSPSSTCWQRFMRIWMTGQTRLRFSRRTTRLAEGITFTWWGGGQVKSTVTVRCVDGSVEGTLVCFCPLLSLLPPALGCMGF